MTIHTAGARTEASQTAHTPWSVKGIPPHTREAVKEAARRSGMTIGEWLNTAITRQTGTEPEQGADRAPAHAFPEPADARWAEVAAHLARLVRRDAAGVAPPRPAKPAPDTSVEAIGRWLREAEARAARREQVRAARVAEALVGLARYIDNTERTHAETTRRAALEQAEAMQELSRTLVRVARHVKGIDGRLAELPREAAAAALEAAGQAAAAQAELLASRLLPVMEQRLAASLKEIVDSLPSPAPAAEPTGSADEQLVVEDRLARAIVDIRARQVELARLDRQIDGEGQQAIIERLETLSRKLDESLRPVAEEPATPALGAVLEQLGAIRSRLDESRPQPALERVETMVRDLSEHVEALHREGARRDAAGPDAALDTLAAQISQLAQRLDDLSRTDTDNGPDSDSRTRLQHLESAIGVLSLQLRDLPQADEATLERVARAAAREALGAFSPDEVLPGSRYGDTLETVHSTLERIVDRLALIEEDFRADSAPDRTAPGEARTDVAGRSTPELRAAQALSRAPAAPAQEPSPLTDEPEDLLARNRGGLTDNIGLTASFIAAARRAALAGADETRQRSGQPTDENPSDGPGRRRSLLIGLGALVAATGAAQVSATLMHSAARLPQV